MKLLLYSPAVVCFVWAGLILAGADSTEITALGRILLGTSLAFVVHQELHDHSRQR